MAHYASLDVTIRDVETYREYMRKVKPAIEAANGCYPVRGAPHKMREGDSSAASLAVIEFPSAGKMRSFFEGPACRACKALRESCGGGEAGVVLLGSQRLRRAAEDFDGHRACAAHCAGDRVAPGWIESDMTAPAKKTPLNAEILMGTPGGAGEGRMTSVAQRYSLHPAPRISSPASRSASTVATRFAEFR